MWDGLTKKRRKVLRAQKKKKTVANKTENGTLIKLVNSD